MFSKGRSLLASILAALCLYSATARAVDDRPLRLEPTSRWEIDYDDESCVLRRKFASDGTKADLEIQQQAPGPYFRVTVTGEKLSLSGSDARVRFDPDGRFQVPEFLISRIVGEQRSISFTDSLQPNVIGSSRPNVSLRTETRDRREAEITSLSIDNGFDRSITIAIGEMHEPMDALRTCMIDLYASWGVDLEAHDRLTNPLQPQNYAQVVRQVKSLVPSGYSQDASELPVVVRTVVGPNGRVVRCSVHFAEWPEELAGEICDLVTREARFLPARDFNRKPIASYQAFVVDP